MKFPRPYIEYLVQFHATRDFFECHELLEEYWKRNPNDGKADLWVGLIQLAVGQYHERRGNAKGASKMYKQADLKLAKRKPEELGLSSVSLLKQLEERLQAVNEISNAPYKDINLDIIDSELKRQCDEECRKLGLQWGTPSPLGERELIDRHKLRDRSDVVAARQSALAAKRKRS